MTQGAGACKLPRNEQVPNAWTSVAKLHSVPVGVAMSRRFNVQVQGQPRFQPQGLNISMSQALGMPKTGRAVGQGCKCPATRLSEVHERPNGWVSTIPTCQRVGFPHRRRHQEVRLSVRVFARDLTLDAIIAICQRLSVRVFGS